MKCNQEVLEKAVYKAVDDMSNPERLNEIDVYRVFDHGGIKSLNISGRILHVFGSSYGHDDLANTVMHHVTLNADTGKVLHEESFYKINPNSIVLSGVMSVFGVGLPFLVYYLLPNQRERRKEQITYDFAVKNLRGENMKDLEEAVKDIKIYQLPPGDVSNLIGKKFELVDTKKPETFLSAEDHFWLRVRAYELGADAVVGCQIGSSTGTPVRFKK